MIYIDQKGERNPLRLNMYYIYWNKSRLGTWFKDGVFSVAARPEVNIRYCDTALKPVCCVQMRIGITRE